MEVFSLKCPYCGATLEPKDGLDTFYCSYCGGKVVLSEMSDAAYKAKVDIKRIESDAKVSTEKIKQESEIKIKAFERDIVLKKNEYENEKNKRNYVMLCLIILVAMNVILWFFVFGLPNLNSRKIIKKLEKIEIQINQDIEDEKYDSALLKANQLYYSSDWSSEEKKAWDNKRENYINLILEKKRENDTEGIYLPVPASAEDLKGKKYSSVAEEFKKSGFTNVSTAKTSEDKGLFDWKNTVEHISISGKTDFIKDETYEKESQIIIYYYSKD